MKTKLTNGDTIETYTDETGTYSAMWQIGNKTGDCYQKGDEVTDEADLETMLCEQEEPRELRVHKIYIFGDRMADVTHSEGMERIALNDEHFINGDQGTDEKCLSCEGGEYLEQELKRLTGCDDVEWAT